MTSWVTGGRETSWETGTQAVRQGVQGLGKADASWELGDKASGRRSHKGTCGETIGDKGRQDLEKADTPSNKGTHVGRQGRQDFRKAGISNTKADALRK